MILTRSSRSRASTRSNHDSDTRYVVLLRQTPDKQIWLGYDHIGRIGNATYREAFRYVSVHAARMALKALPHKWSEANVLATLEETAE